MAKNADANAAGPADIEMNQRVGALSTIDNALIPTEGTASLELPGATESCHRKDRGVRAPRRGQGRVWACLVSARELIKVSIHWLT